MCMREIFDVVNMAERYMVPDLMEASKSAIKSFGLTDDNLIENAAMAEEFQHFGETSLVLSSSCQNYLGSKLKTFEDAVEFIAKHASTEFEGVAVKMLASLKPPVSTVCSNCRNSPCRDGILVTDFASLLVGCVLRITGADEGYWNSIYYDKVCKVLGIHEIHQMVSVNVTGSGHSYNGANGRQFRYGCVSA